MHNHAKVVDITGDILYMSCYITMMQDTWLKQWTCQTPIEVSKEYDVTLDWMKGLMNRTLNCTDSKGANPFASYLEAVGYTETIDLYFTGSDSYASSCCRRLPNSQQPSV